MSIRRTFDAEWTIRRTNKLIINSHYLTPKGRIESVLFSQKKKFKPKITDEFSRLLILNRKITMSL